MANFEYSDPKEPTFWQNGNHGPGLWKLIVRKHKIKECIEKARKL